MKRLVMAAALLVSMGAIAAETAKTGKSPVAKVESEETSSQKTWFSLDEWAKNNKLKQGTLSAEVLLGYEYSDLSGNGTG